MGVLEYNNRLDYGESLMPEDGWETSWAIGTTYSLDLEVLMAIPLALFHGKFLTESTTERNLCTDMLNALDKVRERMFVFVHENNIRSKCGYSMLMGFLDQSIWNIPLDAPNKNFHPKVWLIRYTPKVTGKQSSDKEYQYRLIITSRNISSDTNFDIAITMDSYETHQENSENTLLAGMMTALMQRTGRKDIIKQLENELKHIRFAPPYPFNRNGMDAIFWPHTFKEFKSPLLQDKKYDELLVISPFIDDKTLDELRQRCRCRPILVSSQYEMDKCKPDSLRNWDCYMWNPMLEDAQAYEEDEVGNNDILSQSIRLHAKIFIIKATFGHDWKKYNNWFIGSTNCTQAGLRSNYEAQVQLRSLEIGTSGKDVLDILRNPDAPLITQYVIKKQPTINEENQKSRQAQRELLYNLSHLDFCGSISKGEDGKYVTTIHTNQAKWNVFWKKYRDAARITLKLFSTGLDEWDLKTEHEHQFPGQFCQQLSSFLRVSVVFNPDYEKDFLLQTPLIIPEERHSKIMSEILDSEEKLLKYLMFCLDSKTERKQQYIGQDLSRSTSGGQSNEVWLRYALPIYEKLLLASSRNREILKDIGDIIKKLRNAEDKEGNRLLSKEFLSMWNNFSKYAK